MESISFEDSGKLLREGDSLETGPVMGWLSASGTIKKSIITAKQCLENLRQHYKTILMDYPTLRIKLIMKDSKQFWCYATDEEIQFDSLIKIVDGSLIDDVPQPYESDIAPLWRVHLIQLEDQTKIKVVASHGITDRRCIFDLLELFGSYAQNKEISEKLKSSRHQPVLYEFGKKDWFTKEITDKKISDPYGNFNIKKVKINPPVSVPSHVVNPQWDVSYKPISKFCRKYGITPQAILMAIQNEAIRIFNKGKIDDDLPIAVYIPVDNRNSPYTSELFKKSLFFSHVGIILPFMEREDDILENMKNCGNVLKKAVSGSESCEYAYNCANIGNSDLENYNLNYPDPSTYVFASHLGLVGVEYENIQFRSHSPVLEGTYWPNLYGFHNKDTFCFMFNYPYNCPDGYFESIKDTSLKYYDFIVKNAE